MKVRITRLRPDMEIPAYKTEGAAGFDLAAAESVTILPKQAFPVPTGIGIGIPSGHVLFLTARSSLFLKKGLMLANGIGTIDSDYSGPNDELKIIVFNPGDAPITVEKRERLVNAIILPFVRAELEEGPAESPDRGGLGSTGGYA
ncbi:dUTP diphosphatase [Candidatus Uhrbacteria bacterium]|nr:dUTP diphosphatase [Candidatus Uhrbacteria bacterium]